MSLEGWGVYWVDFTPEQVRRVFKYVTTPDFGVLALSDLKILGDLCDHVILHTGEDHPYLRDYAMWAEPCSTGWSLALLTSLSYTFYDYNGTHLTPVYNYWAKKILFGAVPTTDELLRLKIYKGAVRVCPSQ